MKAKFETPPVVVPSDETWLDVHGNFASTDTPKHDLEVLTEVMQTIHDPSERMHAIDDATRDGTAHIDKAALRRAELRKGNTSRAILSYILWSTPGVASNETLDRAIQVIRIRRGRQATRLETARQQRTRKAIVYTPTDFGPSDSHDDQY